MNCPICHHVDSRVIHTDADHAEIRRRRECLQCRHRWTSIEMPASEAKRLKQLQDWANSRPETLS
jgi:transcriptional regulator NrdR family protein